ncbi:hypothetical protein RKE30_10280 [Streptomyces sp. Li-HN-5-11]|uniref:hypothetical protein n=1 Tax=Streptomyces sp. Li-HN-5-11 TaxID=3075432 RepID=UPI0028AA7509|nr:hypothetical protein [Streptomyces sp. Li-HN-5-11]WNM30772.1 hypothetical protein RKE30_10280 [Streptomyces sp. Li-HN-5-11]
MIVDDLPEADGVGDPPADVLVAELLDSGQIPHVDDLFTIGTLSTPHPHLPPRMKEFLREAVTPPGWTAQEVRRAESFFSHHHGTISMAQATVGPFGCHLHRSPPPTSSPREWWSRWATRDGPAATTASS